jgi:hypothetical protein
MQKRLRTVRLRHCLSVNASLVHCLTASVWDIAGGLPEVSISAIAAELFNQLLDKDWLQEVYLPSMCMRVVTTQPSTDDAEHDSVRSNSRGCVFLVALDEACSYNKRGLSHCRHTHQGVGKGPENEEIMWRSMVSLSVMHGLFPCCV